VRGIRAEAARVNAPRATAQAQARTRSSPHGDTENSPVRQRHVLVDGLQHLQGQPARRAGGQQHALHLGVRLLVRRHALPLSHGELRVAQHGVEQRHGDGLTVER